MPRIFDNIEKSLLPALREGLTVAYRADFCVGYFNLRGWRYLDEYIENWPGGAGQCCRLLVGMHRSPEEELQTAFSTRADDGIDNQRAIQFKRKLADEFKRQLTFGAPTNQDEAALRRLARQIKENKVEIKLYLRHPLHAKLYLLYRRDSINPIVGYLGSSNLTFAGLSKQGELNVDVLDHDAGEKLQKWFEERWTDRWCLDISKELVEIIEESWAREKAIPPHHIYVKMAYHLSEEAREGLREFQLPRDFRDRLFQFQAAAVKIAAHHLNKRRGVLIGDVVGLGKTLMATALARIFEDNHGFSTLIICPKSLVAMWQSYVEQYGLRAKVVPISRVVKELPEIPARFRLVLIDESHNLRNRDGKRYRAIHEYIQQSGSRCILLSATPYNKTYLDLANQLRLFIREDQDLGIRPERLLRELGEVEFNQRFQCPTRSLAAFEKSLYADDWRELMRLYLVRRTRSFIQQHYAETDDTDGRKYLLLEDGSRSYFPARIPRTVVFPIDERNPDDQYARLYADEVVAAINDLRLPRYGLGNYVSQAAHKAATPEVRRLLDNLGRAGQRLMGFCRTNLFKRLESSGQAFLLSLERHVLRNYVFLHALENDLPVPIGTQDAALLDARDDEDETALFDETDENDEQASLFETTTTAIEAERKIVNYQQRAAEVYELYRTRFKNRFKWLAPSVFLKSLAKDLRADAIEIINILDRSGRWSPQKDTKLQALLRLLTEQHPHKKVLIFTQFADTVNYLEAQLRARNIENAAGVSGASPDPTALAWRFSPVSNNKRGHIKPEEELRVLIATDVLSEGQNLQDCATIINYDLPWAIIRLIQRAGRVDRIGQQSDHINCYSFLPADGVERIIRLRARVLQRLQENAEVVGTDESFFEGEVQAQTLHDLYNEKSGTLDVEPDTEVDLASYAFQIWQDAVKAQPQLQKLIPKMSNVVFSTRPHQPSANTPEGVLVYLRTAEGNDALAWIDQQGRSVTESQFAILKAAQCAPATPALPRQENHHDLVRSGVELIAEEERAIGGQLGPRAGARFRVYERLKRFADEVRHTLFAPPELEKAIDDVYRFPLYQAAADTLNRQIRSGITDDKLADQVIAMRDEGRLCIILGGHETDAPRDPQIICSLGLRQMSG